MARGAAKGPGKRVRMNREALDAITLGMADGAQAVAVRIVQAAERSVGDAPVYGVGLRTGGMAITVVNRRKVAAYGPTVSPPRSERPPAVGSATYFGLTFPGRFQEFGTIHHGARPALTPATTSEVPGAGQAVAIAVRNRLKTVRDPKV